MIAAGASLAAIAPALASPMAGATTHSPNGDNGTVKVHRTTTSADDPRNEPHVCGFYLVGFHFDGGQQVSWRIVSWPPTGNRTEVLHGALTLGQDGHGRTADLTLPNGHYKLYWNFAGENGRAKQKVFWVRCEGTTPSPSPTSTAPGGTAKPTAAPSPSSSPLKAAPAPTPVPSDLPVTG